MTRARDLVEAEAYLRGRVRGAFATGHEDGYRRGVGVGRRLVAGGVLAAVVATSGALGAHLDPRVTLRESPTTVSPSRSP